jgi:hypothetical protein
MGQPVREARNVVEKNGARRNWETQTAEWLDLNLPMAKQNRSGWWFNPLNELRLPENNTYLGYASLPSLLLNDRMLPWQPAQQHIARLLSTARCA